MGTVLRLAADFARHRTVPCLICHLFIVTTITKNKTIRFTEEEFECITKAMQAYGYLSFSNYVRDTVLQRSKHKLQREIDSNNWL